MGQRALPITVWIPSAAPRQAVLTVPPVPAQEAPVIAPTTGRVTHAVRDQRVQFAPLIPIVLLVTVSMGSAALKHRATTVPVPAPLECVHATLVRPALPATRVVRTILVRSVRLPTLLLL